MQHTQFKNIRFIEPQAYLDFLLLMQRSQMIFTDSGGIQKEAYILAKPCVTLRPETEWLETVQTGWNLLLPVNSGHFPLAINDFKPPETHPALFGENVAEKIMQLLENK